MPTLETPLVEGMIHRPDAPAHMMRLRPAGREVIVRLATRDGAGKGAGKGEGEEIARSRDAMVLIEIGRDVHDPAYYLPLADAAGLVATDRTTHCPLKGDTTYYDLAPSDARGAVAEIAWSYADPLEWARDLRGLVAFDPARVGIETAPL